MSEKMTEKAINATFEASKILTKEGYRIFAKISPFLKPEFTIEEMHKLVKVLNKLTKQKNIRN